MRYSSASPLKKSFKKRSMLPTIGLIGITLLVAIAVVALILGINFAIAYFFVYKPMVHLGAARYVAYATAVFYWGISGLSTNIYLAGRKS